LKSKNNKIKLYTPTELQRQVHQSNAIIRVVIAGRRFGKNVMALNDMMFKAWTNQGCLIWWTALVYKQSKRDYRRFINKWKRVIKNKWDSELRIELINGSIIEFYSLQEPDNLLGEGIDYLYIDEVARVKKSVWTDILSPMLLDSQGKVLMFSTPKGRNWIYDYFLEGQKKINNIESWQFKTIDNPYIDNEYYNITRNRLPTDIARQEFDAVFIDTVAGVFQNFHKCIDNNILKTQPELNHKYRIGIDLAKLQDWTVCIVLDTKTNEVVAFRRFNQIDYTFQKRHIVSLVQYWSNADIVIDSTGVGEPIYDDLKRAGCNIIPYSFTNASKVRLIENLIIKFENQEIKIPGEEFPELLNELEIFEYKMLPGGSVRYGHPSDKHDDCVISLALAVMDGESEIVLETLEGIDIDKFVIDDLLVV